MDSDPQDLGPPKYLRWGYFDRERVSDQLLSAFLQELPGDGRLPSRWKDASKYADQGLVLWAASTSSHTLVLGGVKILRIWTDASNHCWVEGAHHVLPDHLQELIPTGNFKKSKPFSLRAKITTAADMCSLAKTVRTVYGI